jgi:hypothetical protein
LSWSVDVGLAPPGVHYVSFISEDASGRNRAIKKIFVTRVNYDSATQTFSAEAAEGTLSVRLKEMVGPKDLNCCKQVRGHPSVPDREGENILAQLGELWSSIDVDDPDLQYCPPAYLLRHLELVVTPDVPFAGQFSDLPFEDPWWKTLLAVIAIILLIAAAIVFLVGGGGGVVIGGIGNGIGALVVLSCCAAPAVGAVIASIILGAGALVTGAIAATKDGRDPFRRGQDNTSPAAEEFTLSERVDLLISYPEPVTPGKPFAVGAKWEYTRETTGASYTHSVSETNNNIHVLSRYHITHPDVVRAYKKEPFIVKAEFFDQDDKPLRGDQLFVQCILQGPAGQHRRFMLQDSGIEPDEEAQDGVYTGIFDFVREEKPAGIWIVWVIAQDVNNAQPDLSPEQAAQIIGGMVRTHQLTITFDGGTCPLVPDGHVNVISV